MCIYGRRNVCWSECFVVSDERDRCSTTPSKIQGVCDPPPPPVWRPWYKELKVEKTTLKKKIGSMSSNPPNKVPHAYSDHLWIYITSFFLVTQCHRFIIMLVICNCCFHLLCLGLPYYFNSYTKESVWEKPTEPAKLINNMGDQVQCAHLLVKHCESRRPASWRSDNITRSKEEALQLLQGGIAKLKFN